MATDSLPPAQTIRQLSAGVWTAQALWAAACLGIADQLASGPKTAEQLAAATGTVPHPLYRVLRALASLGVFAERGDGRIENTAASETLRADVPGSTRDYVIFFGQKWHIQAHAELLHSIRTGQPAAERVLGKTIWEFFAEDAEQARIFNAAMTSIITETAAAVRDAYDFRGVRRLVDIGGGHGMLLGTVVAANSGLRGVLFDLPHVVEGAGPTLERLGVRGRVTTLGGDFFADVPRGDAYLLSHIIHDWDDERSAAILRTIRRAAEPGARVLVVEAVIPPLNAASFGKLLDLEMLALPGGVERTENEYRDLLAAGGFRLTRVVPTAVPVASVIEGTAA